MGRRGGGGQESREMVAADGEMSRWAGVSVGPTLLPLGQGQRGLRVGWQERGVQVGRSSMEPGWAEPA